MRVNLQLQIGRAELVITPPLGVSMAGYYYDRRANDVIDDLYARAVVFADGQTRAALVVCDLIEMDGRMAGEVRRSIQERSGVPAVNVMICCTHTHTGPLTTAWSSVGLFPDESYLQVLARRIADAVVMADQRRQPARLEVGHGQIQNVAYNRRYWMKDGRVRTNPPFQDPGLVRRAGPEDPDLSLLFFRGEQDQPLAVISNFAVHPDQVSGCAISADHEGAEVRVLKQVLGQDCAVLCPNGCCGDLNHWDFFRPGEEQVQGPWAAERSGRAIAGEAIKQLPRLEKVEPGQLRGIRREFSVQLRVPTAEEIIWAKEVALQPMVEFDEQGLAVVKAHRMLEVHKAGQSAVQTECTAIALGEIVMVGLPGEIFVELGLEIKRRSPFRHTLIFELCNDNIGYILTPKAYEEGGYESTSSHFQPDSGARLVECALGMLEDLHRGDSRS